MRARLIDSTFRIRVSFSEKDSAMLAYGFQNFAGDKAPEPQVYDFVLVAVGRSPNGKLIGADGLPIDVASRHGGAIEASSLLEHDGKFYLFVSFDQCCKGVASTYNIRVGRADRIEGPYRDKDGKDMMDGGGALVLATTGRFIGPGGQEAVKTSKGDWLAYHYYDGEAFGASKLQFSPISWTADGWPELGPLPQ